MKALTRSEAQARLDKHGKGLTVLKLSYEREGKNVKSDYVCSKGHLFTGWNNCYVYRGSGCPVCLVRKREAKKAAQPVKPKRDLTVEVINERLKDKGITLISGFVRADHPALFLCSEGHEFEASPSNIMRPNRGCTQCSSSGYKTSKPGSIYLLSSTCYRVNKIGITGDMVTRHYHLKRQTPFEFELQCVFTSEDGELIKRIEAYFKEKYKQLRYFLNREFESYSEWYAYSDEILDEFKNLTSKTEEELKEIFY